MDSFFKWDAVLYFFPKVLSALPVTLLIVLVATVGGLLLGLLFALVRIEKVPVFNSLVRVIVSFLRGTPILIQMFIVYFGIPLLLKAFGVNMTNFNKMAAIYITYALNASAFFSEILRSSILSIPASQMEAAWSVGLTQRETYIRIIFPQAIKIALPSLGTQMISLLQDTSLAFSLGIIDMIGKVKSLSILVQRSLEGYIVAAIIFIVLSFVLEFVFRGLERKTQYA